MREMEFLEQPSQQAFLRAEVHASIFAVRKSTRTHVHGHLKKYFKIVGVIGGWIPPFPGDGTFHGGRPEGRGRGVPDQKQKTTAFRFISQANAERQNNMNAMKQLILTAAVLAGLCSTALADLRITGGGKYNGDFGETTVTISVQVGADGSVSGQFEQHNPAIGLAVHGSVNFIGFVGNTAYVGGLLTKVQKNTNPEFDYILAGDYFLIAVQDLGNGGSGAPDKVSPFGDYGPGDISSLLTQAVLENQDSLYYHDSLTALTGGNFQIKH